MFKVHKFIILLIAVSMFVIAPAALAQEGEMDNTFEVNLESDRIDVPENLPAGPITFAVTNNDAVEREFQISGQGLEEGFGATLQPGETRNIEVDFQAGPYEFFYPGPDYREQGMFTEVTVLDIDAYEATIATEEMAETDVDATVDVAEQDTKGADQEVLLPETGGIASPLPTFLLLAAGATLVLVGLASLAFVRRSR